MNLVAYLKKNGIRRAFEVLYKFKLQLMLEKTMLLFTRNLPLKDIIIIESHNDFDCNGGAFYQYLLENGYNKRYKIIWVLKHEFPKNLPENVKAVSLNKPGLRKAYYRCFAKIMTADCYLNIKVRPDQKTFYFTHGPVALKNCKGLVDMPDGVDYCLAPSKYYAPIMADQMSLPYPNNKFVYLGYPIHDCLYTAPCGELSKITTQEYRTVILWMPTFRKGGGFRRVDSTAYQPLGIPLIESDEQYKQLNDLLAGLDCLLIIKIHPMQAKETIKLEDRSHIKVLTGESVRKLNIDNYRLMKETNAIISDYSSVAFDYLHLNRPIAYVMTDKEEYKLGFVVEDPHEMMAGDEIYDFRDMLNFIQNVANGQDNFKKERAALFDKIFMFHDGESCKRIADFMNLY